MWLLDCNQVPEAAQSSCPYKLLYDTEILKVLKQEAEDDHPETTVHRFLHSFILYMEEKHNTPVFINI